MQRRIIILSFFYNGKPRMYNYVVYFGFSKNSFFKCIMKFYIDQRQSYKLFWFLQKFSKWHSHDPEKNDHKMDIEALEKYFTLCTSFSIRMFVCDLLHNKMSNNDAKVFLKTVWKKVFLHITP